MGDKKKTMLFIIIILIILILVSLFFHFKPEKEQILDVKIINLTMEISTAKTVGFDLDPGKIGFGKVGLGSRGERDFEIANDWLTNVLIELSVEGDIAKFIQFNS